MFLALSIYLSIYTVSGEKRKQKEGIFGFWTFGVLVSFVTV
jgi:hypothetical protein